jgi:hypothetical protein
MPAESKAQRKFMGMVHAVQKGEISPPSSEVAKAAKSIAPGAARDFAVSKEKGLPEHKKPPRRRLRRVHVSDKITTKSF